MLDLQLLIATNKAVGESGVVLNEQNLLSALSSWHYYEDIEEQVASIFLGIIKNHGFVDGNKRTAVVVYDTLCKVLGLQIHKTDDALFNIAVLIAQNKYSVSTVRQLLFT